MRTSPEIQADLNAVEARLLEITPQHEEAAQLAANGVRAVALGEASLSDLQTANLRAATLLSVVDELHSVRSTLESELAEAQSHESHEDLINRATAIAGESEAAWNEYFSSWQNALEEFESATRAVVEAQSRHWQSRCAFEALPDCMALINELRERGVITDGLRSTPLESASLAFSVGGTGGDISRFEGFGAGELVGLIQRVYREIAVTK